MSSSKTSAELRDDDVAAIDRLRDVYGKIRAELGKVIIGQHAVIERLALCMFARGHALLMGVPGLAKTLLVNKLAETMSLKFSRIQFTPDLMPSDIVGTEVIEEDRASGSRMIRFIPGPVFANIILADEINRTPPKTQSALLEAMQEYQVTVGGVRHQLERPLFVLATQNPIEQEGTYPLPEAQLDRFMLNVVIGYPTAAEEKAILAQTTTAHEPEVSAVATGEDIERARLLVREIPAADNVIDYATRLVRATRPEDDSLDFIKQWVRWGAGPRAGQALLLAGKARAVLQGRPAVSLDDLRAVAAPVLRHRLLVNFQAEAEGVDAESVVARLLDRVRP
jgi:MoxR-like ATPase